MIGGEKRKRECAEVEWKGGRVRERERETAEYIIPLALRNCRGRDKRAM